jgi:PAS domain S-box-containing protein
VSPDSGDDSAFRGCIETSPDAVVIANPATREIVEASRAAEAFFGYSREELRSMDILDLHPDEERQRYEQLFAEHFENQPAVVSQFDDGSPVEAITADGERIPVEINAWAIDDEDLDEPLFQGVFRDVSERLRRTRELQRERDRLEEFASVVSHDLRTPLSVAEGRATLIQEEHDSEHVGPLLRALDRMETIIEDTLVLARNGQRVGEMETVALAESIEHCWTTVEAPGVTLDIVDDVTIEADPDRFRHICENLIRNAVEHGGEEVTVRVGRADAETIYFEDDGPGIPEDEQDAVFEPGYSSTSEGTGFGLAIVRELAEAHGWTVTLTESDTGGARFEFGGVDIAR